ncbi:MAG TPA: pyridoxal phosphate-dependent aminotransferase family protein [Crocinitomicaceae bacterium]|nr:pyridoxal phosphate-dependent aminotransferase family protein [Crocinitomicaceae bacterium]
MDQRLLNKLITREKEGTLRSLSHFEGFTDFFSNDYLGLASVDSSTNLSHASTGSRLISGTSKIALNAEKELAEFFKSESALLFNSGYDANLGFFSSVPQRGDTIIYDELIHASVRDGIRLSFANQSSFSHNDAADLTKKIKSAKGTIYVAIEALYSMDGDLSPLRAIQKVCQENNAYLIVDEAHSVGVFGEDGRGFVAALELENKIFARLVTFGKAYGSHGAVIFGSEKLTQFLSNFSRSFIYTTALPDSTVNRNLSAVLTIDINDRRRKLQLNLAYFRKNFKHSGLLSEVNSPIQILQIGDVELTNAIANKLQKNKLAVKPIFSPTVALGQERLRLCFHTFNTFSEIDLLINYLH